MKSASSIIKELREIPANERTYELLAEMFFEFTIHETEYGVPDQERVRQLRNLQYDIFRLYGLARAARDIKHNKKTTTGESRRHR